MRGKWGDGGRERLDAMSEVRVTYEKSVASPYAGFWRRVGASLIDGLILLPLALLLAWMFWPPSYVSHEAFRFHPIFYILVGLVLWAYHAGFESSSYQATLGKRALGILVTDLEGRAISWQIATLRNWIDWLPSVLVLLDLTAGSWIAFGGNGFFELLGVLAVTVSCAMVAYTERNQGWHDMIAGCLVVRKGATFKPRPPPPAPKPTRPPGPPRIGPLSDH